MSTMGDVSHCALLSKPPLETLSEQMKNENCTLCGLSFPEPSDLHKCRHAWLVSFSRACMAVFFICLCTRRGPAVPLPAWRSHCRPGGPIPGPASHSRPGGPIPAPAVPLPARRSLCRPGGPIPGPAVPFPARRPIPGPAVPFPARRSHCRPKRWRLMCTVPRQLDSFSRCIRHDGQGCKSKVKVRIYIYIYYGLRPLPLAPAHCSLL